MSTTPLATETLLQQAAGVLDDFVDWLGRTLRVDDKFGHRRAMEALADDLGADLRGGELAPFQPPSMDGIRAYRASSRPSLEAWIEVAADVRGIVESVRALVDAFEIDTEAGAEELAQALLDLLAANYVRHRWPRFHSWLEFARFSTEPMTVFGQPGKAKNRFATSLLSLLRFVFAPLETLGRVAFEDDPEGGSHLAGEAQARKVSDATFFHLAAVLAVLEDASREIGFDSRWGDEGALNALYGWDEPRFGTRPGEPEPSAADQLSERMLSLQVRPSPHAYRPGIEIDGALRASMAWVPKDHGGPGLFVSAGGSAFQMAVDTGGAWIAQADARFDAPFAMQFGGLEKFRLAGPVGDGQVRATAALMSRPPAEGSFAHRLNVSGDNGLAIGRMALAMTLGNDGIDARVSFIDCRLALDGTAFDDFIGSLLPATRTSVDFSFGVGCSTAGGFYTTGDLPLLPGSGRGVRGAARRRGATRAGRQSLARDGTPKPELQPPDLPVLSSGGSSADGIPIQIPIGKTLGPLRLHHAVVTLSKQTAGNAVAARVRAAVSFSARIGSALARVDQLGLRFDLTAPEDRSDANLHFVDASVGFVAPTGVGLAIDAEKVKGGGFLFHDAAKQQYAGVMELTITDFLAVKAFGVIATRLPEGSKGFSMIVMITAENTTDSGSLMALPMGWRLTGVGGLIAFRRTIDVDALRAGMRNRTLESLLFPKDPIRNAPTILAALNNVFPIARGSTLVGVLARLVWGVPKLLTMDLAVIVEWGDRQRVVLLGRISAILPHADLDIVRLNLDAVGVFDEGLAAIDAVLVDSRLLNRFAITGAAALRARWSSPRSFALAVGGMNKNFTLPAGFPKLERVTIDLSTSDNPRLVCESYLAITSNTVQLGAHAHLHASAHGFSVDGEAGFDVLIRLLPFHFLAEFYAGMQLRKGSRNLFKVKVEGALEGPMPLAVRARATFEIFWWDVTLRVNVTLVGGSKPPAPPAVDAFAQLRAALAAPGSWSAELPPGQTRVVSLVQRASDADTLVAHPLGTLSVRQTAVPLNVARDIDKFGESPVAGTRRFAVTRVAIDADEAAREPLRDDFAPAQYFEMSDELKLSSPSYEPMDAGVRIAASAYTLGHAERTESPLEYETRVIDDAFAPPPMPVPRYRLTELALGAQARFGAAGLSVLRRADAVSVHAGATPAVALRPARWAAVADNLLPVKEGLSFAEAHAAPVRRQSQAHAVREFEVLR